MHFQNRQKEQDDLQKYLRREPNSILFLYGPKSCGKSTLLNKVISEIDQKKYAVNFLDLRQVIINNFKSFLDVFFQRDLKSKTQDILSGTTFNIGFFKIGIRDEEIFKKNSFKIIIDQIRKAREKNIQPIIVIDEIQELKEIYVNDGKRLIDELFNLFIALTKVEHLAHIILATSDSYFIQEIYNSAKLSKTSEFYLVNHLEKKDIIDWLQQKDIENKDIDYIYKYLGGSPWEISQVIDDISEGVSVSDAISKRIKLLRGQVMMFYRGLDSKSKSNFKRISNIIASKDYYKQKKNDNLDDILSQAIEKDIWFYEASEEKITANSCSLKYIFKEL